MKIFLYTKCLVHRSIYSLNPNSSKIVNSVKIDNDKYNIFTEYGDLGSPIFYIDLSREPYNS